ncbi:putative allantoate transporter [Leucosporidium creatinivorum]|uniref:Putative allantoate transporter n=1 Tax=Leucosporidium creatinivorum TaxID=106004 RepID=A0A1Y2FYV8_9BASI|nr:putative allantoate transporter [Leucosporidium creatinivorum]
MVQTSSYTLKEKATSLKAWQLDKAPSAFAPEDIYSNTDMEPVKPEERTWTTATFAAYWFSDLVNAGQWSGVASFVALGLTWWESMLAIFTGAVLLSTVIVLNGIIGARLHTPFAVTARAAYGYNLARFAVVSRMVIAWFWFSINTYQGGTGVKLMLIAIWPSFRTFPNHLPASAGTDSSSMLCFFLFWLMQLPFVFVHPSKLRPIFLAKAGDRASAVLRAPSTLSGLPAWYAFMTAVTACMGTWSTMACNIGDFSRYSKKETSAWMQMLFVPALWCITSLFGAIASNMTQEIYGEILWQPFDIIDKWEGSHGGRLAAFVCAAAWALGNVGTNITANSISSANDLTTLFPRWVNILRGQIFAVFIGVWAFAPWKVLATAGSFISFMGAYSIVLAPIGAILAADFFVVKSQKYNVPELYDPRGIYRFSYGVNWRAAIALVVSIAPNMPGMINALNSSIDIGGAKYIYCMADVFGMIVAASVHIGLSKFFPDHNSLVADAVLADDVLAGRVPGYEHLAERRREHHSTDSTSEDKIDSFEPKVQEVV